MARLGRDEKLEILAEIARNAGAPSRERISAIKAHNEMTGEAQAVTQPVAAASEVKAIAEKVRSISPLLLHRLLTSPIS